LLWPLAMQSRQFRRKGREPNKPSAQVNAPRSRVLDWCSQVMIPCRFRRFLSGRLEGRLFQRRSASTYTVSSYTSASIRHPSKCSPHHELSCRSH